jgi:hypothetical protein
MASKGEFDPAPRFGNARAHKLHLKRTVLGDQANTLACRLGAAPSLKELSLWNRKSTTLLAIQSLRMKRFSLNQSVSTAVSQFAHGRSKN